MRGPATGTATATAAAAAQQMVGEALADKSASARVGTAREVVDDGGEEELEQPLDCRYAFLCRVACGHFVRTRCVQRAVPGLGGIAIQHAKG